MERLIPPFDLVRGKVQPIQDMKTKTKISGATTSRRNANAEKPKAEKPKAKAKRTRKPKGLTPMELKEMAVINARMQSDPKGMRLFNAIPPTSKAGAIDANTRRSFIAWKLDCKVEDLTGDQATNEATKLVKQLRLYRAELTVEVVSKQREDVSKGKLSQEIRLDFSGNIDNPDGISLTQKVITKKTGFTQSDLFRRLDKKTTGADKYVL